MRPVANEGACGYDYVCTFKRQCIYIYNLYIYIQYQYINFHHATSSHIDTRRGPEFASWKDLVPRRLRPKDVVRLSFHTSTGDLEISVNGALQARWLGDWAANGCTKISGNHLINQSIRKLGSRHIKTDQDYICTIGHISHISHCPPWWCSKRLSMFDRHAQQVRRWHRGWRFRKGNCSLVWWVCDGRWKLVEFDFPQSRLSRPRIEWHGSVCEKKSIGKIFLGCFVQNLAVKWVS